MENMKKNPKVENMNEVWEVLQTGSAARAVGSTNENELSSRSHWFVNTHQAFQGQNLEMAGKASSHL